jgi:hypothetical protein
LSAAEAAVVVAETVAAVAVAGVVAGAATSQHHCSVGGRASTPGLRTLGPIEGPCAGM